MAFEAIVALVTSATPWILIGLGVLGVLALIGNVVARGAKSVISQPARA